MWLWTVKDCPFCPSEFPRQLRAVHRTQTDKIFFVYGNKKVSDRNDLLLGYCYLQAQKSTSLLSAVFRHIANASWYPSNFMHQRHIFQPLSTKKTQTYFPFSCSTLEEAVNSLQNRELNFFLLKWISNALEGKKVTLLQGKQLGMKDFAF